MSTAAGLLTLALTVLLGTTVGRWALRRGRQVTYIVPMSQQAEEQLNVVAQGVAIPLAIGAITYLILGATALAAGLHLIIAMLAGLTVAALVVRRYIRLTRLSARDGEAARHRKA